MKILVVKTSSLGDLIHTFPAITDLQKKNPDISIDWVVEESLQEIPKWHPAVKRVIPVAVRRWRKKIFDYTTEYQQFISQLRETAYDKIIDAQGLIKSALIARMAKSSCRAGFAAPRELAARWCYHQKIKVQNDAHAIVRIRQLFAGVFDYTFDEKDQSYGLSRESFIAKNDGISTSENIPYLVFLHGTTWATKHWPTIYWQQLASLAAKAGWHVKIPWGNHAEQHRALAIAGNTATVLPRLSITQLASVLASATGIVAVDTGFAHVAAALGIPCISLYGPTDPKRTGAQGDNQIQLAAEFACAPCLSRVCTYQGVADVAPACFERLSPEVVMQHLHQLR